MNDIKDSKAKSASNIATANSSLDNGEWARFDIDRHYKYDIKCINRRQRLERERYCFVKPCSLSNTRVDASDNPP